MSELVERTKDAAHATVAAVAEIPQAIETALEGAVDQKKHPRLARAWRGAAPLIKVGLLGAAFVGGGMLLARWFGGSTARSLGREGGEGFARGVNAVNDEIDRYRRSVLAAGSPRRLGPEHRGSRFNR